MKKKLLTGLTFALALTLCACGSKEANDVEGKKESKPESKKESVAVEDEVNMDELAFKRGENVYFWASTLTTGTPNELSSINTHINKLPVTEDALNDTGEYYIKLQPIGEGKNGSFTEMVDHEYLDALGKLSEWTEKGSSLQGENDINLYFEVHNPTGETLKTKREMYDNGYWYLETTLDEHYQNKKWNESTSKWELFDYYIETLGKPSYISVSSEVAPMLEKDGAKYFDIAMNNEYIEYNKLPEKEQYGFIIFSSDTNLYLVWEYNEFVLTAKMFEWFMADDNIRTSNMSSDLVEFRYYPKKQWYNYWKPQMDEDLVDMHIFEDHGEILDNNIPEATPAPKVEECVLPEGDYLPTYSDEIILEIDGKAISLLENNSWNIINELELTPTEEKCYVDEADYDKFTNGIPKDYSWGSYGYGYLKLEDKYYNGDYNDVRIKRITIDNQHIANIPEIKIFGLGKDSTVEDIYKLFGNPEAVSANQDEDGNCVMRYGRNSDMFITENIKMDIYIKFIENKFSQIDIEFTYMK